jgi:hypothetical protein
LTTNGQLDYGISIIGWRGSRIVVLQGIAAEALSQIHPDEINVSRALVGALEREKSNRE